MGSERTADDVFRLLADEIRLDVLRAVAVAQDEAPKTGIATLSFSEIYERVDVSDTAKLSYHLGELTGTFLRKREEGYAFTHAGEQLVRFVLAENYRQPPDFGTVEADGQCPFCGGSTLQATYHEQFFFVECSDCSRPVFSYRIRPAQIRSRSGADLIAAVAGEQVADFLKMRTGVCPDCGGRMDTDVVAAGDEQTAAEVPLSFGTVSECRECLRFMSLPLPIATAYHQESVAFHWERGVDVLGSGVWELYRHLNEGRWTADRIATDQEAYRVTFEFEDATLRQYVDGNARVERSERVRRVDHRERTS